MRRRRHRRRRNPVFVCKKIGKKKLFGRKRRGGGRRRKSGGRRKPSAGFRKSAGLMKAVWRKHRAALMRMSPKRRFKAAWAFARKMR